MHQPAVYRGRPQHENHSDSHTEVSYNYEPTHSHHRGGQRVQPTLAGSCCGAVVGIVLLCAATILLWTNEGVAVRQEATLAAAERALQAGDLVHYTGALEVNVPLRDDEYGIEVRALLLERVAEVFQWRESKTDHKVRVNEQTTRTETTYHYAAAWESSEIRSTAFKKPQGHYNPSWAEAIGTASDRAGGRSFGSRSERAVHATLRGVRLAPSILTQAERPEAYPHGASADARSTLGAQASGPYVYSGPECTPPREPTAGCVRLSWRYAPLLSVSVLAARSADGHADSPGELVPWASPAGAGYELALLEVGPRVEAQAMLAHAQAANEMMTWLKRAGGGLLTWVGWALLCGPAQYLASWVPILSGLVGCVLSLVALGAALAHSLLVIAVAWIAHRPLLAASLLAVVGATLYLTVGFVRTRRGGGGFKGQ